MYIKGARGKEHGRGREGTCPSHSCAHLPASKLSISGISWEVTCEIKGDTRARSGKRKASLSCILSQLALLATRNGELAHSYPFPPRSNACHAGYIVRKRVKKALSQSLFGMPDCVTYTLRSCESTIFRLHIRKRSCGSSIPHVSFFFYLKHCKMLLFFPGRFEEEFSTAN